MASYPSRIVSFETIPGGDYLYVDHLNDPWDELIALELNSGLLPKGTYSTVAARIQDFEDRFNFVGYSTLTGMKPADKLMVYDTSESELKEITWNNILKDSYFRAQGHAGLGSVDTKIPYFSTITSNIDNSNSWTHANNASGGLSITIDTEGVYSVSFVWTGREGAISLNTSQTTINPVSINSANRVATSRGESTSSIVTTFVGRLSANDVIRPHVEDGGGATATSSNTIFSIVRLS